MSQRSGHCLAHSRSLVNASYEHLYLLAESVEVNGTTSVDA